MDTFQPPPPLPLPDLVTSMSGSSPNDLTNLMNNHPGTHCLDVNESLHPLQTILPNGDNGFPMATEYSTASSNSNAQFNSASNWTPATPSSSSSTYNDCPMQQQPCLVPPPPSPPAQYQGSSSTTTVDQLSQPTQLPDIVFGKVVDEFEKIMSNENDKVVLTNSVCLLFRFSIDSVRGFEVCQGMSSSPKIMNQLYYVLMDEQFKDDDLILCYATGNLTNMSKYQEGRAAILGNGNYMCPSPGVESLICSLKSRDSNVVIFAITAIHNLLLDGRIELQENAKRQIRHGLKYIVQLLGNECLIQNYEFKVIVLDCLQILAYGNGENRLAIMQSDGPRMLLHTIEDNFNKQLTEEITKTLETASRVLKSLSACPSNKIEIIQNGGINILTKCITIYNHEILKTCLWTLRNLSDVLNNPQFHYNCIDRLVSRILQILNEYSEEPSIITCALGILANLTCNNDEIKQLICNSNGIDLLLKTIAIALSDGREFRIVDTEILEPAVCALCHLMNQNRNPNLAEYARMSIGMNLDIFKTLTNSDRKMSNHLCKAVEKLYSLVSKP